MGALIPAAPEACNPAAPVGNVAGSQHIRVNDSFGAVGNGTGVPLSPNPMFPLHLTVDD